MTRKTFMLGVGGQKCGTTWVNRHLERNPTCFTTRFEMHVWDALTIPVCAHNMLPAPGIRLRLDAAVARFKGKLEPGPVLRHRFQQDTGAYFDFFDAALSHPGTTLAADITPSYAGLSVETLGRLRSEMEGRGHRVAALFIMRDPVERCWSAIRMKRDKNPEEFRSEDVETSLRRLFKSDDYRMRTEYHRTVERLTEAFPPEDLMFAFTETLFTREGVDRLSAFLGIEPDYSHTQTRENARPKTGQISEDLQREIAESYAEVYRAIDARFGGVREIWPSARFVLE